MKWVKNDHGNTIAEIVEYNTGISTKEFLNPKRDPYLANLEDAVQFIQKEIAAGSKISVIGDYDCDGITSSTIMDLALTEASGVEPYIRIPRRFSEGYGLSMKIIDEIDEGLIITVDNGIAAIDQIKAAKEKGLKVVVIDHHLPVQDDKTGKITLPEADIILDPHAIPGSDFKNYCGAGLAYRVAKLLVPNSPLLTPMLALASIGTVADVMTLTGDNRNIVIDGLEAVRKRKITTGLDLLLNALKLEYVTEGDYGFKLGPVMNAAGRLHDDGPIAVIDVLKTNFDVHDLSNTYKLIDLEAKVNKLIENNEDRKEIVRTSMAEAEDLMTEETLRKPIILYSPNFSEGIIGIIAGQLAEEYCTPALVFTDSKTPGVLKGSGRTYGTVHLKHMLDSVSEYFVRYGGHAGAAGMSVKAEDLETLKTVLNEKLKDVDFGVDKDHLYYDLEIPISEVDHYLNELDTFAPYGEGNPQIVFKVDGFICSPVAGKFTKPMGKYQEHVKFYGKKVSAIGFDLNKRYFDEGEPKSMDFVGMLGRNFYKGVFYDQIEALDFQAVKKEKTKMCQSLEDLLVFA